MRYEVTTGLTPPEALEQAAAYFGPGGVGLHAITQTPQSLVLAFLEKTRNFWRLGLGSVNVANSTEQLYRCI